MAILTSNLSYALDSFDPKMTHGSNPTPFGGKEGFFIDEGRVCFYGFFCFCYLLICWSVRTFLLVFLLTTTKKEDSGERFLTLQNPTDKILQSGWFCGQFNYFANLCDTKRPLFFYIVFRSSKDHFTNFIQFSKVAQTRISLGLF